MLSWLTHYVSPFFLGCLGRLSLKACRSSFLWPRPTEDSIVLGNVFCQCGLSLFILELFFLIGMGLGLYMKWARSAKFFDPTKPIINILIIIVITKNNSNSQNNRKTIEKHFNERQGHNHYHYKQKPITLNSHIIKSTNAFLPKKNQLHIHTITIVTATFMA